MTRQIPITTRPISLYDHGCLRCRLTQPGRIKGHHVDGLGLVLHVACVNCGTLALTRPDVNAPMPVPVRGGFS